LEERDITVKAIRAAFVEGDPIFPNSALGSKSHVQIAVRDLSCLRAVWEEPAIYLEENKE
jgi:hypothetical protein